MLTREARENNHRRDEMVDDRPAGRVLLYELDQEESEGDENQGIKEGCMRMMQRRLEAEQKGNRGCF